MSYCGKHGVEYDGLVWCPMCLEDELTLLDELARDATDDARHFRELEKLEEEVNG